MIPASAVTYNFDPVLAVAGGVVPWRDGLSLPRRWEVEVDDPDSPYLVRVVVMVEEDAPAVDSMVVDRRPGGPPVSNRALRQVHIGDYLNSAAHLAALRPAEGGGLEPAYDLDDKFDLQPASEEHLQEVAKVYGAAVADGRPARKAVQNDPRWRPVPTQTAARWIRIAKDRGFIPEKPTKPTKRPQSRPERGGR